MKFKKYWPETIIALCILLCYYAVRYYYLQFHANGISNKTGDWGLFGDYIGGFVGTSLTFFSIILIYATYKNQVSSSLIQQFETTFFNLLQNQREILKSLKGKVSTDDLAGSEEEYSADKYISAVAKRLHNEFDGITDIYIFDEGEDIGNFSEDKAENEGIISSIYNKVYTGKEAELGHYFRHLYHTVKYVHESKIPNKKKYVDIIQAQMSDDELYVTFYNCIGGIGKVKFKPMLEVYHFFENLKNRGTIFKKTATQFFPSIKFK